jgi:hypothetical protein
VFLPLLLILIFCKLAFSQDFFQFELEERQQADTTQNESSGWLIEDGSSHTLEYRAVDLEYSVLAKTFNLNDKAQLKYRTATLTGDTIIYSQSDKTIEVIGNPIFRETSQPSLASYKMKYNLSSKVGEIVYGTSYLDNQQFNGTVIRAITVQVADSLKEQRFLIEGGDFSTCSNPTHQHYTFFSRRMVVKPKESVTARPVVLNMGEVPVAVLPMMVSPLKSGRSSGLLTPKFGGDQAQGFFMNNLGFYYAPNDYWDAQIYADVIEGDAADFSRSGLNGEVRYNKRYMLDGFLNYKGYWNDGTFWRDYDIRFRHSQNITPDRSKTLNGEGSFVSRQHVRQENGLDEKTVLNQQANAYMTYYQKIGDNKNITVKTGQEYNLQTGRIERQAPDIRFGASGPMFEVDRSGENLDQPFREKLNYSFSNRSNHYVIRAPDTSGAKPIDTTAYYTGSTNNLSINFTETFFNVLNITPSINLAGDWSAKEYVVPEDSLDLRSRYAFDPFENEWGETFLKGNASVNAATKLYGIWLPEWGRFTGIRHTLSPTVSYTYAPELEKNRAFHPHPLLNQRAFQDKQKRVGFGLGNDFDMKYLLAGADEAGEDADMDDYSSNWKLLQTSHSTGYDFAKDSLNWDDISSNFSTQVWENYYFTINTTHSFYHKFENDPNKFRFPQLTYWSYGLDRRFMWNGDFNVGLPSKNGKYESLFWNASMDYRYSFSSYRVGRDLFRDEYNHYAFFSASISPSRKWNLQYSSEYSFREGQFTSHSLQFARDLHCWKMDFSWRPAGAVPGWTFTIYVSDLPDVRLSASNTQDNY